MSHVRVEGKLDPNVAWDGTRVCDDTSFSDAEVSSKLRGAAGWVQGDDAKGWCLGRDPLGINKLFWVRDRDGTIVIAARPRRLVDQGFAFEDVQAIPPGVAIDLTLSTPDPIGRSITPPSWFDIDRATGPSIEVIGSKIRGSITGYLDAIASSLGPGQVFVCLSGGLDSSGIAALACEVFPSVIAVSFDLRSPNGIPSEDRAAGARVAADLKMPLLDVTVTGEDLLDHLDSVLVEGIDWRDFNVHAALVNTALAEAIAGLAAREDSAIVLTGDLANEFLVDYEPESYRGTTYYRLPRLRPAALRASLVRGLDTSNREIGAFAAYGLPVIQPYAVAVDAYLSLPEDFLHLADRKQALSRMIFGPLVPEHVYTRKKVRAQVGSATGGGVLGLCVDHGIDPAWLRRRFSLLHGVEDVAELDRFIRAGRYRSGVPSVPGGRPWTSP
jgi:asparagine synthetase B (glutamine-hydrolysing)